ncbi:MULTISPECIES: cob(I)yrinic acid a,c-diamide adenosyltransferase [unclassified Clostridium]|uniref:cob(I)yrinic acid a,c-diamide adenosyltransferase n=1 Tax=unclassified Clostridium TaxID=2614128 RepID=UPI00189BB6F1|nr:MULTISPECIES: cob(I)yrinic acid a,c-diamide adenosyltransferase [unclassified Clostridium]MCR1952348.1 cob(I)yrinic acid a,c-diamide adenosyltransferase [Clostridium sp. DSM 100503]
MNLGFIHMYCGSGKTTAAMGVGVKDADRGNKALLTKFIDKKVLVRIGIEK